jgi:hypothetical protein
MKPVNTKELLNSMNLHVCVIWGIVLNINACACIENE